MINNMNEFINEHPKVVLVNYNIAKVFDSLNDLRNQNDISSNLVENVSDKMDDASDMVIDK